jgi:hypothetical protein
MGEAKKRAAAAQAFAGRVGLDGIGQIEANSRGI